jgi:hypothetical protein
MSLAPRPKEMRRVERQAVCYRCEINGIGAGTVSGLLVDISPLGCLIRCSREVVQGTVVSFDLPIAGQIKATIIWSMGGRIGMEFTEPVDLAPYFDMLSHLQRPSDEMDIY